MSTTAINLPDGRKCYTGLTCQLHFPSAESLGKGLDKKLNAIDNGNPPNPLAKSTPVKIDEVLAKLYYERFKLTQEIIDIDKQLARSKATLNSYVGLSSHARLAEAYERNLASGSDRKSKLTNEINGIYLEEDGYEAEFTRRGGWTRAFYTQNNDGHIHKSRSCSQLRPTTRLAWVTSYSGKNESEVIEDAGKMACTTCYPNAPVETRNRPSKFYDPDVRAAQEERAEKKAAKEAKAAVAAITNRDGSELKVDGWRMKTLRTAEIAAVDRQVTIIANAAGRYPVGNPAVIPQYHREYAALLDAIAFKKGWSTEDADTYLKAKAQTKFNKEW